MSTNVFTAECASPALPQPFTASVQLVRVDGLPVYAVVGGEHEGLEVELLTPSPVGPPPASYYGGGEVWVHTAQRGSSLGVSPEVFRQIDRVLGGDSPDHKKYCRDAVEGGLIRQVAGDQYEVTTVGRMALLNRERRRQHERAMAERYRKEQDEHHRRRMAHRALFEAQLLREAQDLCNARAAKLGVQPPPVSSVWYPLDKVGENPVPRLGYLVASHPADDTVIITRCGRHARVTLSSFYRGAVPASDFARYQQLWNSYLYKPNAWEPGQLTAVYADPDQPPLGADFLPPPKPVQPPLDTLEQVLAAYPRSADARRVIARRERELGRKLE